MNVKIIKHYAKNDPKFDRDYTGIDIIIDGDLVIEYGDSYHDNGQEKSEGFVDALNYIWESKFIENLIIIDDRVADGEEDD